MWWGKDVKYFNNKVKNETFSFFTGEVDIARRLI
jgi:hypothetical protein